MAEVRWTEPALADLKEVHDYIARDSPAYARLHVERIVQVTRRLARFPESGRRVPEFPDAPFREVLHGDYRVLYSFDAPVGVVWIRAVVHARRRLTQPPDAGSA
jgi:plasmid stabilization system protein ParE